MSTDANREPLPIVALTLPRCPNPDCRRALCLKVNGTPRSDEYGKIQYVLCRACAQTFVAIWD